jgi:hypothetical protein
MRWPPGVHEPAQFSRCFAAEMGVTPARAVERLRVEGRRAAEERRRFGAAGGPGLRLRRPGADAPGLPRTSACRRRPAARRKPAGTSDAGQRAARRAITLS